MQVFNVFASYKSHIPVALLPKKCRTDFSPFFTH